MEPILEGYHQFLIFMRGAVFVTAVVVAVAAVIDWAVRTRKVNPFGPLGRFSRRVVDPMMKPIERRVLRSGGLPTNAPWWALATVVVGGLLLLTVLGFAEGLLRDLLFGFSTPGRLGVLLVSWAFGILRIALFVRVISSWLRISEYSRWVRWSYVLTEWMLAPLRRVIPLLGQIDVTPIVAYLLLSLIQSALGIP